MNPTPCTPVPGDIRGIAEKARQEDPAHEVRIIPLRKPGETEEDECRFFKVVRILDGES